MRKYALPSLSSLIAFEAVARLQGFARAAHELNTSQPAISRHIRNLEIRFGAALIDREVQPISLTAKGEQFYAGLVPNLDGLENAVQALQQIDKRVTLVCSHSLSHLLLLPRYGQIRAALGKDIELRLMTAEYNLVQAAIDTGADIVFEYARKPPKQEYVVVCKEEVKPVGTAALIQQAQLALQGEAAAPALLDLQKDNFGWSSWADWQKTHPDYGPWKITQRHDSYVYLLENAANGDGLALGWRGFVDAYLARGQLIELPCPWYATGVTIFARLTRFGRHNPIARKCLGLLENLE